jgi:hypothetical protein
LYDHRLQISVATLAAVQADFINEVLRMDNLKAAVHLVKVLGLGDSFPDLDRVYREEVVSQLLARGRWAVAAKFVGDDQDLQERVTYPNSLSTALPV